MDISYNTEKLPTTSSGYTSSHHKAQRRLKLLHELEDRKLQLNHDRLAKAQNKVCRQLDLQRLQFTRRFSESSFNPSLLTEELSPKLSTVDSTTSDNKRIRQRKQNSFTTEGHNPPPPRRRLRSHEDLEEDSLDYPPFWLRLRSLGVPSDEDIFLAALACKSMNINEKHKLDCDDVFEPVSHLTDGSRTSRGNQITSSTQRSSSVTGVYEASDNKLLSAKGLKRSASLENKKPDWLLALCQMKREKLSRLNCNTQEEIAALVSGNKFYDSKRCHVFNVKYRPRNYRLIKSHRHTVVGMTNEFTRI
uniref:Uncharacterized protein n=1 Tax=Trichobilharzia regenti TaxID=157069 RepID=A0AA85KGS8_TRIRE|nr:unnamed protein product [Trichobilharzia regenti]